jgi:hypothetical protein
VKERQQSMTGVANPGPTDLLVLGADYENLGRFKKRSTPSTAAPKFPAISRPRASIQADSSLRMAADSKQAGWVFGRWTARRRLG